MRFSLSKSPIKGISDAASSTEVPQKVFDLLIFLESTGILGFLKTISSFIFWLPIMGIYIVAGVWMLNKSRYASSLLMLNLTGFALLAVLFVFSMASDVRYIYLTMCFFHASHPLFFMSLKDTMKQQSR